VTAKGKSPGTGFVVSLRAGQSYLVTSAHVVEGDAGPAVVFLADPDRKSYPARVVDVEGGDPRGLALLLVETPPAGLRVIEPQPVPGVAPDTSVRVAGFPVAIGAFTVLPATVASIKGRDFYLSPETGEGFSGGPVLVDGRVVGLVFGREGGFGKAVSVAVVAPYLRGHDIQWVAASTNEVASAVEPKPGAVRTNPNDGQPYVWIPPGEFQMGCSPRDNECDSDENPPHTVRITRGFWLGQTEVTVGAYKRFVAKTAGSLPAEPVLVSTKLNPGWTDLEQPMAGITWYEARSYCESWAKGGLPTEAEWEYAARAGSIATRYADLDSIAWYADNSGGRRLDSKDADRGTNKYESILQQNGNRIHTVRQKQPNRWGLYDMLGNVWEWVADWYGEKYYSGSPAVDPRGPAQGRFRVLRGGSWYHYPQRIRASLRTWYVPDFRVTDSSGFRADYFGFRCVWE